MMGNFRTENAMKTQSNSDALSVPRLIVRHWLRMVYGRICHAIWLRLPDSIAMHSRLGSHLLAWAGYWANATLSHKEGEK